MTDSLQDMLDIDIKSEVATDLGSASDFSVNIQIHYKCPIINNEIYLIYFLFRMLWV